jgi:DNA-binding response OmpR family regulator
MKFGPEKSGGILANMQIDESKKRRQARILIAGGPEGFGRLVSGVIEKHLGQKYDLHLTSANHADEVLILVRDQVFDVFIVIADSISFSSETPNLSREDHDEMVLQLIRHLKGRYDTPVLALHGWRDPDFGEKIDAADFTLKHPRIFDELREAVQGFIEGNFDEKAAESRKLAPGRRRGTVLVMDNEVAFCQVCKAFLESTGFKTHIAHSADHAFSILDKIKADVLITGLLFPGINRHHLTRLIKKRYDADVIIMTEYTDTCDHEKETPSSAGDLLYKPVGLSELQDSVERIMRRRNLEKFRQKFGYAGKKNRGTGEKQFSQTEYFLSNGRHTAAIIPEEEGLRLMGKLKSLGKVFRALPDEPGGGGALPPDRRKTYDPNLFFQVFDRLRPMDGCTLDYCFHRFDGFRLPYIYTRRIDSTPVKDYREFNERFPYRRDRFRHIAVEPSPSGYFQFAVFYNAACQSHLIRNCRWGLTRPMITENQLKRTLDFIAGQPKRKEVLEKDSLKPRIGVVMCEDIVHVIFIAFNPFRGLYFQHTYIRSNVIEYVSRSKILDCDSSSGF